MLSLLGTVTVQKETQFCRLKTLTLYNIQQTCQFLTHRLDCLCVLASQQRSYKCFSPESPTVQSPPTPPSNPKGIICRGCCPKERQTAAKSQARRALVMENRASPAKCRCPPPSGAERMQALLAGKEKQLSYANVNLLLPLAGQYENLGK